MESSKPFPKTVTLQPSGATLTLYADGTVSGDIDAWAKGLEEIDPSRHDPVLAWLLGAIARWVRFRHQTDDDDHRNPKS